LFLPFFILVFISNFGDFSLYLLFEWIFLLCKQGIYSNNK
jgi:hypothetical protein